MSEVVCAYLGPEGTFTHQATKSVSVEADCFHAVGTAQEIISGVEAGIYSYGLVPIENSAEGEVISTIDELIFKTARVYVREEVVVPVTFDSFALPDHGDIDVAMSHPHALAQCRQYIRQSDLRQETTTSTAEACRLLVENGLRHAVALASPLAGPIYGLVPVASQVQDNTSAHTKFYLLSRKLMSGGVEDARTWLAIAPASNRTGVLSTLIGSFADRGISIESISSRPFGAELGAYVFLVTVAGWIDDPHLQSALGEIVHSKARLRVLGSFPRWSGEGVVPSVMNLGGTVPQGNEAFGRSLPEIPRDDFSEQR